VTNFTFNAGLFDGNPLNNPNPDALQLWQSGTLTLDDSSVSGVLSLPGYYKEPIPFTGSKVPPNQQSGTIIVASGKSSEVEIEFTISYGYDGFLYSGSYLGGLVSMLDYSAQETYLYVINGISPDGPFGAKFRGSAGATDKRKPKPA
jgi:hypothetical protein